ncbi:hypothetical protein [Phormidesmis sp. 146-33]
MLKRFDLILLLTGVLCLTSGVAMSPVQTRVSAHPTSATVKTHKETFDRYTRFIDEACKPQKRTFQGLKYQLCLIEDLSTRVSMQGPEGENGPTAYFYSGKLFAFRDTGRGEAQMFKDGRLIAEVEVGKVAPGYNKITTKFSPADRKALTDRALSSSQNMLKVFGRRST